MWSPGNRFFAVLFAIGVLAELPFAWAFQGYSSDPGHKERCEVCCPLVPVSVNLADAHADEPQPQCCRPAWSSDAKQALEEVDVFPIGPEYELKTGKVNVLE